VAQPWRLWLTRRPSRWSAIVPVAGAAAGLLFAASAQTAQGTDLRTGRTDLADIIRAQSRSYEQRVNAVQQLRTQVEQLTQQSAPGNTRIKALQQQSETLAPGVGTAAVTGPAITVSLNDAKRSASSLPSGFTADDIVVHQQDVQGVVNALWAGGAEAMMLQDQRVISTSAVRCVGNTLILQGRVYSPPYVIKAIGNVPQMQQSLDRDRSVGIYRQYVDVLGLGYDVRASPQATFPAYTGSVNLQHATVAR